jgi:pre-rRNA-processing protein TSR4
MAPVDPTVAEAAENTKEAPTEELSIEDEEEVVSVDEEELVTAIAAATLEDSQWLKTPVYKALYLSTCSEYLPPASKSKLPSGVKVEDQDERSGGKDSGGFAPEGYENSLDTDHVFDRFSSRVAHEPEQCVR